MAITKYLKGECQHCGGRLEFQADHIGLTADCPHCGQPTELMLARPPEEPTVSRKAIVWSVVAVVILGLGLGACLVALRMAERRAERLKQKSASANSEQGGNTQAPSTPAPVDPLTQQGFAVSAIRLEKAPGTSLVYAMGELKNLASRQRFGVKIELELTDAAGGKVGIATDYQQVIEPGAAWRFRALVVDAKAMQAKLLSVKEDQ